MAQGLEQWFLDILVCPETKAPLVQDGGWLYSTDAKIHRRYAVRDGIPNMLIEESELVSEEDFRRVMEEHRRS